VENLYIIGLRGAVEQGYYYGGNEVVEDVAVTDQRDGRTTKYQIVRCYSGFGAEYQLGRLRSGLMAGSLDTYATVDEAKYALAKRGW
jgi:hypothetical protein